MTHFCSQCGLEAELEDSWEWPSTEGPVSMSKIVCPAGHWFTMRTVDIPMAIG